MKLYSYFRSSAAYRARIALNLKQIPYEYIPIHLVKDGGQQNSAAYRKINPSGHVPALDHDGFLVTETVAICAYLDAIKPENLLFPKDARGLATVMRLCEIINSGIQPLQNLKVTNALEKDFGHSKDDSTRWVRRWVEDGFKALENTLTGVSGKYSYGDTVTAADAFLVPQCFSARRFGVVVENFPLIAKIEANATQLESFKKAHPEQQPDFA